MGLLEVALQHERAVPQHPQRTRGLFRLDPRGPVNDGDVGAFASQFGGNDRADAAAASDQRNTVGELHGASLADLQQHVRFTMRRKCFRAA
jgi:hypothetical protein